MIKSLNQLSGIVYGRRQRLVWQLYIDGRGRAIQEVAAGITRKEIETELDNAMRLMGRAIDFENSDINSNTVAVAVIVSWTAGRIEAYDEALLAKRMRAGCGSCLFQMAGRKRRRQGYINGRRGARQEVAAGMTRKEIETKLDNTKRAMVNAIESNGIAPHVVWILSLLSGRRAGFKEALLANNACGL